MLWQPQDSKVMTVVKHYAPQETILSLGEVISLLSYSFNSLHQFPIFSLNIFIVNEIQSLVCRANNGSFTLTFRENTTLPISTNATINELKTRLEQIYTYITQTTQPINTLMASQLSYLFFCSF